MEYIYFGGCAIHSTFFSLIAIVYAKADGTGLIQTACPSVYGRIGLAYMILIFLLLILLRIPDVILVGFFFINKKKIKYKKIIIFFYYLIILVLLIIFFFIVFNLS